MLEKNSLEEFRSYNDDEKIKHIYAMFGLAVYNCQCFETELQLISLLSERVYNKIDDVKKLDEITTALEKKTLRELLNRVSGFNLMQESEEQLNDYINGKRNYLMHHYFRTNSQNFLTDEGREKMLEELSELIIIFREADSMLQEIRKKLCTKMGWTQEFIEKLIESEFVRLDLTN